MLSHLDFNRELLKEIKRETIFLKYWSAALETVVPDNVDLMRVSTETDNLYSGELTAYLEPISDLEELKNTTAHFTLRILESSPEIDFEQIMNTDNDDCGGKLHAAYVIVRVFNDRHYSLVEFKIRLWRNIPPEVRGDPRYVRLII